MNLIIAGIDEAGRGAWAGPIVAGACILSSGFPVEILSDSKKITAKQRERLFSLIASKCEHGVGYAWVEEIERLGLIKANNLAMQRAVDNLPAKVDHLLVDGKDKLNFALPHEAIIRGDEKIPAISAASILAKVSRDQYMRELEKNEKYFFAKHKGYGTSLHREQLKKYGPSKWHRKKFRPIALFK